MTWQMGATVTKVTSGNQFSQSLNPAPAVEGRGDCDPGKQNNFLGITRRLDLKRAGIRVL